MHERMGNRFEIVNHWFKQNVSVNHFVELRIDSDRFSSHPDAPVDCQCEHCHEPATKPIICHEQPASLLVVPKQPVPSRGWGEQFWARIIERDGKLFRGVIDNPLYESQLHGLTKNDEVLFHEDHILVVHGIHSDEIVLSMNEQDLKEFRRWIRSQKK